MNGSSLVNANSVCLLLWIQDEVINTIELKILRDVKSYILFSFLKCIL